LSHKTHKVLHVGCGAAAPEKLHPAFRDPCWQEVRLDIDPEVEPDVVASITDMQSLEDGGFDAVFSSHNLEHLYAHEVPLALREFRRVLKPSGLALITLPDLQAVAQLLADGSLTEPAYQSPLGPIAPIDILYGFRPALALNNLYMAHHTGFTGHSLLSALTEAGFAVATVQRNPPAFCLWAIGFATVPTDSQHEDAKRQMFPLHETL
jgi:SAM-dependent methyltransferase